MVSQGFRQCLLFVFLVAACPSAFAASCAALPNNITGWWPGEGTAGDLIGTNNGALSGGATASAPAFVGSGFSFDGTNGYVQFPDSPVFHPSNLTVEAWVKFSDLNSAGSGGSPAGQQYVVFKQNSRATTFEGFDLGKLRSGASDFFHFAVSSSSGQSVDILSTTAVSTGVWYHIAGVRGSNFSQLYVNGQLQAQGSVSFAQDYGNLPLFFGTSGQTSWDHKFKGVLDEVSLYSRALSSNELAAIYSAGAAGKCLSPVITTQPQSLLVPVGSNANFTVAAGGTAPLGYQWRFYGSNVPGATNTVLLISNAQPANSGNYDVVVTNSVGVATSIVASLTVLVTPPSVISQPADLSVLVGTNVNFSVAASGTPPLSFQWVRNGLMLTNAGNVSGATAADLALSNVQTNDSGSYSVIITNSGGSATSRLASLTVSVTPVAPAIVTNPASQSVSLGADVSFYVSATGTVPLTYQWLKDGAPLTNSGSISGAASPALTLHGASTNDAGGYQVVITNVGGAVTSALASLTVNPTLKIGADAVVLVNSSSAKFLDFQHFIQPYLENFGVPCTIQNIATNPIGTNLSRYAMIIIGHKQLDTNLTFLTPSAQTIISTAVSNGAGLVNFDNDLYTAGGVPRYQFIQNIFGFNYSNSAAATTITFPATEPGAQMHYITARHSTNDSITQVANMTLAGLSPAAGLTNIVLCGGKPLVTVRKAGQGRAVQWASYDWMTVLVLGPLEGLDDCVWRGFAWAARKPFVMRGLPNFVTMRVDDIGGPLWWVHIANEVGFKPFLAVFISDLAPSYLPDLRNLLTNGNATACPHAFSGSSFIYFDYTHFSNYSDSVLSNNFYIATRWIVTNGLPWPNIIATHYSAMGTNAFGPLIPWGSYYVPIEIVPGTIEYNPPYAPWLVAGPYRLYETPQQGQSTLPLYYADFLQVPGHPEYNGMFFNCYTEIRDVAGCGEWCPDNNVSATISRGYQILKRSLDSMVLATVFTHDWYIQNTPSVGNANPITTNNWRAIMQGLSNNLAPYNPIYVTLDYGNQYVRATKTSKLLSSDFDLLSGQVSATFSGTADLDTQIQIFLGADNAVSNVVGAIPVFSNSFTTTAATLSVAPFILSAPGNRTNNPGTSTTFIVQAGGSAPLIYRWYRNGTNLLTDGNGLAGASTATLAIANLSGADTGSYSVVVSNTLGVVTSAPPAVLQVLDPIITAQPQSRTNHAGTVASFAVSAAGSAPAYQWLKDSSPLPQATNPTLSFPSVTLTDAGQYNVLVSNVYGSLSSITANLSVFPALRIQSIAISNNTAAFTWSSIPGRTYTLQSNSAMPGTNWMSLSPSIQATGATASATHSIGPLTNAFYRILQGP